MTAQSSIPLKWYVPFAQGDSSRVEIPVTTSDPTRASQTLGFPPLTMQPPESGGVPPQGEDFNGGMNQVARIAWWVLNGGGWPYDSTFAANSNINGYPNGATLQAADFRGDWINTADNNQNNPDTNGTNWVPGFQYGVTALAGLTGGTVTPTPAQAAKNSITLAGTLGSALTIVLPTWLKNWTITNNTTGAFVTIVKTAAGSGVTIPQTAQPTRVSGDGTNITQSAENVATGTTSANPAQMSQLVGRAARFTSSNTLVVPATVTQMIVNAVAGGGGGGAGASGSSATGSGGGGGGAGQPAVQAPITVVPGETLTITIGAAGAASASPGAAGGNGGTTSISGSVSGTLITLTGGNGGSGGVNLGGGSAGGSGGTGFPNGGTGSDTTSTVSGAPGGAGGFGASSPFGGGGGNGRGGSAAGTAGSAAGGFGAGGGGGGGYYVSGAGTGAVGGAGTGGFVALRW